MEVKTTVTLKHEWDMAHRLPFHAGKCSRLHGHRYVAHVEVGGLIQQVGSSHGMIVDFDFLKAEMKAIVDQEWDHKTMLWAHDPILDSISNPDRFGIFTVQFMPTAENISRDLLLRLDARSIDVKRVRVYETPNGWSDSCL